MLMDIYIITLLFIAGLFLGMLFVIIGIKLPLKERCFTNVCDTCNDKYKVSELIPLFSYVLNRGKCNHCKTKMSILIPILEVFTGFLFTMSYIKYGISYEMFIFLIISSLLIIVFVSDFKYFVIMDSPVVLASILVLILKYIFFGFKTFIISLISGLLLFIFLLVIKLIGDKIFKTESLGGGDVKLLSFFGFVLGIRLGIVALILGSFLAFPYAIYSTMSHDENEVPFGPFLVTGLLLTFTFMEPIRNFIQILF